MPTVLRIGPYRFYFWANESQEPPHIHVASAEREAKYWLEPIHLSWNVGYRSGELKEIERLIELHLHFCQRLGMNFSRLDEDQRPVSVHVDDERIRIQFEGGLELSVPTARYPRLFHASDSQRARWQRIGRGEGIHWPDVDEDLSVRGLFQTYRQLPESAAERLPALVSDLTKTTARLNALFPGRRFTADGHLVGSIGEVVAQHVYDLILEPCSSPQIDAHARDGRTVQVKLTGSSGKNYAFRWPLRLGESQPDLLIALQLTEEGFTEIYNGIFPTALLQAKAGQRNGQIKVSLSALRRLTPEYSLKHVNSFESINRWFTPELAEVA